MTKKVKACVMKQVIDIQDIEKARQLIATARNIVIVGHISPDGDAMGASLGLSSVLENIGKNVKVILPNRFPAFLAWLPHSNDILINSECEEEIRHVVAQADLIFCLDFNMLSRINGLRPHVEHASARRILIDHHLQPDIACDVILSHPELSSTSELVYRFVCQLGWQHHIDRDAAEAIYTGIMTDTGGFSYNSQNPDLYVIVHDLLLRGIDKDAIYRRVYNTYSVDRLRLMGYCLYNKMRLYPEYHTAVIALSLKELQRFNFQVGDTEGFVNLPLQINDVDVSIFVREDTDKVKLSFRSQGDFPVNRLAEYFKGGGHKNAAGGESYFSLGKTLRMLDEVIAQRGAIERGEPLLILKKKAKVEDCGKIAGNKKNVPCN